jgi:hypothetical protein
VSVKVNAVVYFRVIDPLRAVVEVENYNYATSQLAQTTLRSVLGQAEMDDLLAERDRLNSQPTPIPNRRPRCRNRRSQTLSLLNHSVALSDNEPPSTALLQIISPTRTTPSICLSQTIRHPTSSHRNQTDNQQALSPRLPKPPGKLPTLKTCSIDPNVRIFQQ